MIEKNVESIPRIEQYALKISMVGTLFFVALGLGFAFYTSSDSILFDGVYSLIAFCITLVTLKVSYLAELPDDDLFHFGYSQLEPLINIFKGLFILVACILAQFSAVQSLLNGGNPLQFGNAIIYSVIATVGCFGIGFYMKRKARITGSGLLKVDAVEWLVDSLLSLAVLIGFVIGFLMQLTQWRYLTPFVDPTLLIIITVCALPVPFKILLSNFRELISMAPVESVVKQIDVHLKTAVSDIPLDDYTFRVMKHGRVTFVLVHLIVSDNFQFNTVSELDVIRESVEKQMLAFNPEIVMEMLFIKDREWAVLK